MPNSSRAPVTIECSSCKRRIQCDAWLLVDLDEHPEMAAQIRDGTLNTCRCQHCKAHLALNLPLLLFVSDAPSPFLFSPAEGNTEDQNRQHAAMAEALARRHLAGIWKSWWLLDGLLALPRADVIALFDQSRRGRLRDALAEHSTRVWLDRLLSVDSAEEQGIVERHPELLDPLATEILRQAVEAHRANGERDSAEFLVNYQVLLTRCRALGIAQAFRDRAAAASRPWNAEVGRLQLELNRILAIPSRNRAAIQEGIAVCQALLELMKTEDDPQTEAGAHGCLALFQIEAGSATDETYRHLTTALDSTVLLEKNPTLYSMFALALGNRRR